MDFGHAWLPAEAVKHWLADEPKDERDSLLPAVENNRLLTLKKKSDFEKLKKFGKRIFLTPWLVVNVAKNSDKNVRAGYTISGKVGGAVIRNKLRRWSREIIRHWAKENALGVDINVVFKPKEAGFYKKLQFSEVLDAWSDNWQKIAKNG